MTIFNGTKQLQDFVPWPKGQMKTGRNTRKGVKAKPSRPAEIWRPEYANLIFGMFAAGMTPRTIARHMSVRWSVFEVWMETKYEVQQAMAKGSAGMALVGINGLTMRASGFTVPTEKVFYDGTRVTKDGKLIREGKVIRVKTVEYYPPETQACLSLLRQHVRAENGDQPAWAQAQKIEHSGPDGQPLPIGNTTTFNTLMLLGSSPDDQQKAAAAYQQLLRSAKEQKT